MPLPGGPTYKDSPAKPVDDDSDIPSALPIYEKPKFLDGKMTFLGLGIVALGMLGKRFGITVPTAEVQGFFTWLGANWDAMAEGVGWLVAAYGKLRRSPRFNKAVKVVVIPLLVSPSLPSCYAPAGVLRDTSAQRTAQTARWQELRAQGLIPDEEYRDLCDGQLSLEQMDEILKRQH